MFRRLQRLWIVVIFLPPRKLRLVVPPLQKFVGRYRSKDDPINKEAIFHYVYGLLHDPIYQEKYAFNLKRELPRIPFYSNFWRWADWGKELMELHIGYERIAPWPKSMSACAATSAVSGCSR